MSKKAFEEWTILELMGHRRLAGLVREETIGAASFIRIDVPDGKGGFDVTQYYNPAAVYCMTPTTQEMAEQVAARDQPQPVSRWELLPKSQAPVAEPEYEDQEDSDEQSIPY